VLQAGGDDALFVVSGDDYGNYRLGGHRDGEYTRRVLRQGILDS
jgi:hypothetical protein